MLSDNVKKGMQQAPHRSLFNAEPSQFAFQGYDTARYFVVRCIRYGKGWTNKLGTERSSGLHTDFLSKPQPSGCRFERTYIYKLIKEET